MLLKEITAIADILMLKWLRIHHFYIHRPY